MSCGNSDILALIDYFQNGTDLSNNNWDNYNYYDLWNAIENGATPPERTVCATFVQADIRSIVFAVLGVFTSPSDYLGDNIDFYYLYLKSIGQEVVSPTFSNFCVGQLYNVFSIGLTAKFRQGQDFNVTMSKVAAIASITFEQGQQLDALLSKSAALQQVVFQQKQTFNVDLTTYAYLLDDYSGAAAAYSVRLLSSTYSGPLVQIRKQGDNAINSFYPDSNNELSLNSTDISGASLSSWIGSENGFVRTWYDQSGNANDSIQTSAASQTQIISSGVINLENSNPALVSTTSSMIFSDIVLSQSTGYLISIVYRNNSNDMPYGNKDNTLNFLWPYSGTQTQLRISGADTTINLSTNNGAQTLSILDVYSSTIELDYNALNSSTSKAVGNFTINEIFDGYTGNSFNMAGNIQEFIVWDTNQNANKTGIKTNVNDKFSIY